MGVQNWAMISDPKLAHKIFVTNGVNTSARPFSTFQTHYYSYDGKGLAFGNGKDWKAARSAGMNFLKHWNVIFTCMS
jgi:hypothetical protein